MDYRKVGLKCGVEIHQQLNTNKLFCDCPCNIVSTEALDKGIKRRLRFSLSEVGDVDRAAEEEFKKKKYNIYRYNEDNSCLVELDEEPPHEVNRKALEVAFKTAYSLNCYLFENIQFMRKMIIDGSNTSGFQRTALIGVDGNISVKGKKIGISGVNLEEDSARPLERHDTHNVYGVDRLGIPLIEIGTEPDIEEPEEAREVAKYFGDLLRSFKETKRGLGTIRQDLNVSIKGGARVELKGVQDIEQVPGIIDNEINRQVALKEINETVERKGLDKDNFSNFKIYELTGVFENTGSKVLRNIIDNNGSVLGIKLRRLKEMLGKELQENQRLATELADRVKKLHPEVKGLFHGDELPAHGITEEEVTKLKEEIGAGDKDNFIIIANKQEIAKDALSYVLENLKELLFTVPSEVRKLEGAQSKYMRPMPGASRMYPETDIPLVNVSGELKNWRKELPELYSKKIERLKKEWGLEKSQIERILNKFTEEEVSEFTDYVKPTQISNLTLEVPKELGLEFMLGKDDFLYICSLMAEGKISKEFYKNILKEVANNFINIKEYVKSNLVEINEEELKEVIKRIMKENGDAPKGAIIGKCLKEMNGQVTGAKIKELMEKIENEK